MFFIVIRPGRVAENTVPGEHGAGSIPQAIMQMVKLRDRFRSSDAVMHHTAPATGRDTVHRAYAEQWARIEESISHNHLSHSFTTPNLLVS